MKRFLGLAAATALLAVPMAAAAQSGDPALEAFQKVCWSAAGDYNTALQNAKSDNWTETQVQAASDANVSITGKAALDKAIDGVDVTLLVTQGLQHTSKMGDIKVSSCKVTASKPDGALIGEGKAWLGGTAQDAGDPTLAIYYVKAAAGAPNHIGQAGASAALTNGGFGVLKFQQDDADAILVYQVYAK